MLLSAWLNSVRSRLHTSPWSRKRRVVQKRSSRSSEALESRALLTSLVAVRPNIGEFLVEGETRNLAPQELTLQFSLGEAIDANSVTTSSITVDRSGRDGTFVDGNEVPVSIGFIGIGDDVNEVVLRFAETLPDDTYRITVRGTGTDFVTSDGGNPFNNGVDDTFDFTLDLAPQVGAIVPQPITRSGGALSQARNQIVVYFNEDPLDLTSATNPAFYRLYHTNDTVENTDDTYHQPTNVAYDPAAHTATLTFAGDIDTLSGAGTYRLRIGTDESLPAPPVNTSFGETFTSDFGSGGAAQITIDPNTSIDGQPITLNITTGNGNGLGGGNPLVTVAGRTVNIELDSNGVNTTAARQLYWALNLHPEASQLLVLTQTGDLFFDIGSSFAGQSVSYTFTDAGSSYSQSHDLGELKAQAREVSGQIRSLDYPYDFPGNADEPGHRHIDVAFENHTEFPPDTDREITTLTYNFQVNYGFTPQGVPLSNLITENQKRRTREIFELYGKYLGVQFVETENLGFTIVTGDMRAIDPNIVTGAGNKLAHSSRAQNLAIMDAAEQWDDSYGGSWFTTAMHEVGKLLGLGHAYDLPDLTVMGGFEGPTVETTSAEPDFPGDHDIVHGRLLYRPESKDIDLYRFNVTDTGLFSAEIIAERMTDSSLLDSTLRLFRENADGTRELISQNDDYFSEDAFIEVSLTPGTYFVGVSASGNDAYDPAIADTGINGTTQGIYDLRLRFRPDADNAITDVSNLALDGDLDGVPGGEFNFWFRAVPESSQLIVDRIAPDGGAGTLASPYNEIDVAVAASSPGDVIRVVGNGGGDDDPETRGDNVAYQIGISELGVPLRDGVTLDVPQDVVVMFDADALVKLHNSYIQSGSSSSQVDRSGASLQVLGTPGRDVVFTSLLDETVGQDTTDTPTQPAPGNWGGLIFRRDVDSTENRLNYERLGIFLDYVAFADMSYGGGKLEVDSVEQIVNPITLTRSRPGIYNNRISLSEDSAISADPDSFEESTFRTPIFQQVPFTTDYGRSGPDISGNLLTNNSTNGLFVRVETAPGSPIRKMTVPGRFDDPDIVHVITQNLEIQGTPGGPFLEVKSPPVLLVTLNGQSGGTLAASGTFNYRMVFVDAGGTTSPASLPTRTLTLGAGENSVRLNNLPPAPTPFTGRLLYRSQDGGSGPYELIAVLNASSTQYVDDGTTLSGVLDESIQGRHRARTDARLAIDPNVVVKLESARIEVGIGAQLIAEAAPGRPIIFTSKLDDRFGRGGTFDTNNDDSLVNEAVPAPGNWGGIFLGPVSTGSFDNVLLTWAGGVIPTDGDFAGFNAIEAHQADLRLTNSIVEQNADGTGGTAPADRFGRTANAAGTIFVRGSQPVILGNIVRDNSGALLTINANALNSDYLSDYGRSRGLALRFNGFGSNQGPLISDNLFGRNGINGMVVRGETLTTQVVMDDSDIVHVVLNEIVVPDFHTYGGIRLNSDPDASLVVKLQGADAGFTAGGRPLDIDDRIGGIVQIAGQPYFPVVLTSLADDTVGAGFDLDGLPLRDTNGDGPSTGSPGDWRSVRITKFAHDNNVGIHNENEASSAATPGPNASAQSAEFVGELGKRDLRKVQPNNTTVLEKSSDDNLRLGFEINGSISAPNDLDVYSFTGEAGSEVWIDIDRSTHGFDPVVELVTSLGQIIAQSDNSLAESNGDYPVYRDNSLRQVNGLNKSLYQSDDWYSTNQRDAGFRIVLPGVTGVTGTYYVRVRSSNIDSLDSAADRTDLQDPSKLLDGLTSGNYQLNVRLGEADEVAGSAVKYSDIRFATNGIEVFGQPVHSPLSGEYTEGTLNNNNALVAENVGNLLNTDRAAIALSGRISAPNDVDFYRFNVRYDDIQEIPNFTTEPRYASVVFDIDYADGMARGNTVVSVFTLDGELIYVGRDSNISDDRSGPLEGADIDDLSRGSAGELDPYIGPVELPEGEYYVAVHSNDQIPAVLDQHMVAGTVAPQMRLEPLMSVERIADEHFGGFGTGVAPKYDLFDNEFGQNLTPFHLGDVNLFVSDSGENVYMVNPFTGTVTNTLGSFSQRGGTEHADIAMRPDGELYAYWFPNTGNDGSASTFVRIDTGTATPTNFSDDGINTFHDSDANPGAINVANSNAATAVTAFTFFGDTTNDGLFVATRGDGRYLPNLLYQFNITTGTAVSQGPLRAGNGRVNDQNVPSGFNPSGTDVVEISALQANGTVSGISVLNGNLFGVDNTGRFYQFNLNGTVAQSVQILDPTGVPAVFTGLANGPDEVEGGFFANTVFAVDANGVLYALGTAGAQFGVGQPVFVNGQTTVNTGIGALGLDFGTLDRNLWSTTGNRATDPGHGMLASQDNVRLPTPGGGSLYFGNQRGGRSAGNKNNLQTAPINDVNFPGGAHGSFITNHFSLEGYHSSDKPVLYFNYFLETEDTDYIPFVTPQLDSFRVYIGDGDYWNLLGTNDSYRGPGGFDDEQDYGLDGAPTTFPTQQTFRDVVELYDEPITAGQWRQARIDLSNYAGRSDLRLRFEFATAGAMNVGDITTVGEEFYVRPGRELRDGNSYIFEGVNQHEIDMGFTLVAPGGRAITAGETFTIQGVPFEFTKGGTPSGGNTAVPITDLMTAQEVAIAMERVIDAQGIATATHNLQTYRDANRINLMLAPPDPPNPGPPVTWNPNVTLTQSASPAVQVEGAPGVTPGTTPVVVHAGMTRAQVAEQVAQSFANLHLPAGAYYEAEFNNQRTMMGAQDLETQSWTLTPNNTITASATLPHVSIIGTSDLFGGTDFYRFVVPNNNTRVVVDIDGTSPTFSNMVQIWDNNPASLFPLFTNSGSGVQDVASNHANDAFLDVTLNAGTYYVQVGATPQAGGAFPTQRYTMHLSVAGHAVNAGPAPAAPLVVPRQVIKGNNDLVRIIGHYVSTQGPMRLTTRLQGDEFGGYFASQPSLPGVNNAVEGVYVDDIVIGFAERGEMVTGAGLNANFRQNPEVNDPNNPNPYNDILEGPYDLEIRRASDYASSVGNPQGFVQAFETNDRLTQQQTLIVADSWDLSDGQTFVLSDGVDSVTFEYDDVNSGDGVAQGHQPIPFDPIAVQPFGDLTGEPAWVIAARIRDAVNSPAVQGILDVRASLADGAPDATIASNSRRVNFYGNVIVTLLDGVQGLPAGRTPPEVEGKIRQLGNSAGSSTLFSFTNLSATSDAVSGYPRWITGVNIQLPAGRTFDPSPLLDITRVFTGSGPTQAPGVGTITPTFSLNEQRDMLSATFPSLTDGDFALNERLDFGIDVDFLPEPTWYIGSVVEITFSSGPAVLAEFVADPTSGNIARLRPLADSSGVALHNAYGDSNRRRDQGQILIQANIISDSQQWGILSDAGSRDGTPETPLAGDLPHAGPPRNLQELNVNRLVPGILIENNLVVHSGTGGILFSGDDEPGVAAPVPFGRISNNTVAGDGSGTGIRVEQNASPTLLNNIVADLSTGVFVDNSSRTLGTVVGTTLYRGNGTNANTGSIGLGTFPIVLGPSDPLFVDESRRNYYLAPLSPAIDSSLDSLNDRTAMNTVRAPLGISVSPILAPDRDVYGQLRGDDPAVNTPAAQGANVFKDRGAIDRVDFFRPTAQLTKPLDQAPTDLDPTLHVVWINEPEALNEFIVSLNDVGIGVDDGIIASDQFRLFQDGVELVEGSDYVFVYNSTTNEVIFRSVTQYPFETRYRIEVDNNDAMNDGINGVRDLAGNYLAPNQSDGTTMFNILVTDGVNDPPINSVPDDQTVDEDTDLFFSAANGNRIAVSDADVHLGNDRLLVTLTATNGLLSLNPAFLGTLSFTTGDGTDDLTMEFEGVVADINAALNGMKFRPDPDYFGPASLVITTDDQGQFTGPPSPPQQDTDTVLITVNPVNDPPVFDPVSDPPAIDEDAGPQTVAGFMTGQSAGPANETPPQTITAELTVVSTTGSWSTTEFFAVDPAIDTGTGDLTYTVANDVNGTATVEVVLRDSDGAVSAPQTFVVTVNAINDEPVFTLNPTVVLPITVNEDSGLQTVPLVSSFAAAHAGAIDEIGVQDLDFVLSAPVVISPNLAFDLLEIDDQTGELRFQSSLNTAGIVELTLTLTDDGPGAPPPNDNTSQPVTFRIVVNQVNDAPVADTPDYEIDEGDSLMLDASASFDVDEFFGDTLDYEWDLNGDGTFDIGPTTADTVTLTWAQLQAFGITAPAVYDVTLRVTDDAGLQDTDTATLTTRIVDYGDAPDSYGTLRSSTGAAHTIDGSLFLGSLVDKEMTGVPTGDALGDDTDGGADEDGVNFVTWIVSDGSLALPTFVDVTASAAGKVDAWIDYNGNGTFDHATEHLNGGVSFDVVAGVNRLFFTVPAGTPVGDTYARFRISSDGGLQPTDRADDGEVEDYTVKIRGLQPPITPTITKPADADPGDGLIPQTSDLTPRIEWSFHETNYFHDVVVRDSGGNVVFAQTNLLDVFVDVTPALPAGEYTVSVTASNRAGTTAATANYDFEVVPLIVSSPAGGIATTRPVIHWNHVIGTQTYHVQIESLSTGSTVVFDSVDATTAVPPNAYPVMVDLPIGRYQVRVRATDACDLQGDWSPFQLFDVKAPPVVTAPGGTITNTLRPQVTWTSVPGAVSYELQLDNATDNIRPLYRVSGIPVTQWTPPTDLNLAEYTVWVRAYNALGETSFWSAAQTFVVAPSPTAVTPQGRTPDATPTFSWNSLPQADTYRLTVRQMFGAENVVIDQQNLTTTTFTQPTPLPLGRYSFRISATNEPAGSGGPWGPIGSSPGPVYEFVVTEPPVVTRPQSTTFSLRPVIEWVKPLGSGTSEVWVEQVNGAYEFERASGLAGTSYTPTQDFPIGNYVVWVRTMSDTNPSEPSDWSIGKKFRVVTPPVLIGPTGRTPDSTPTLSWNGVLGGQTYEVWINNNSIPLGRVVNEAGLNSLSYTVPDELPIGRYTWWSRATNAFGVSSNWSAPKQFEIVTPPVLSGPPASTFDTTPSFSWNDLRVMLNGELRGATEYEIRIDEVTNGAVNVYQQSGLTGLDWTVPAPLAVGNYKAWVRGFDPGNGAGAGGDTLTNWSAPVSFFVGGRPLVNPPGATTDTTPTITWQAVEGAAGYEIFIALASDPANALIRVGNIGVTQYEVETPLARGDYRVWVRAINSANGQFSQWSSGVDLKITDATDAFDRGVDPAVIQWAVLPAGLDDIAVAQTTTVGMLQEVPQEFQLAPPVTPASGAAASADPAATAGAESEPVADTDDDADEVLSDWHDQAWWDQPVVIDEPSAERGRRETEDASARGVVASLLALTPALFRRRRDDSSRRTR